MNNQELELLVEDIVSHEEKLSDWERNFISDVSGNKHFSPKQAEVINKIWDRVTE